MVDIHQLQNRSSFLTAEWRKLAFANYSIDPAILAPFLPAYTELDLREGQCLISLVGFMFKETRLRGFRIPWHTDFPEVNLRFYVRFKERGQWKRGVTFIKEFVPRPALSLVARMLYAEPYETLPMKYEWQIQEHELQVGYQWKKKDWNHFTILTENQALPIAADSLEEFITEHYWGYTRVNNLRTSQYQVTHPRWLVYPVSTYEIKVDFGNLYGKAFAFLCTEKPQSVMLAEGSAIQVMRGNKIEFAGRF